MKCRACGYILENKKELILHILSLGCFDENLEWKDNSKTTKKSEFTPTEEQIKRWKEIPPTNKTISLLKKKEFSDQDISIIKTQYDAHIILNNLKKENI